MICGLKWKTCDCPWFNYEAVETDRLNHMNIPQPRRVPEEMGRNVPRAYHEELNRRHEEDRRDEALHHLQALGLDDRYGAPNVDDYLVGGPRDILGIGNAAGHFLNEDFVRRATHALGRDAGSADNVAQWLVDEHRTNLAAAEPPPERQRQQPSHTVRARLGGGARTLPPLRHHSVASRLYNNDPHTRASERVVPRRVRTDYAIEAARHRPNVEDELREMHDQDHGRRHSAMAGLTANTQEGRIGAWLEYVEEEDLDAEAGMPVQ